MLNAQQITEHVLRERLARGQAVAAEIALDGFGQGVGEQGRYPTAQ